MDLAREVSFAEPEEDDGIVISCGLSLAEAIRYAKWNRCPLNRLDACRRATGFYKRHHCSEMLSTRRCLQPETQKPKQLKRNTLAIVNFALLCSYPVGMTCQLFTRCIAACLSLLPRLRRPRLVSPVVSQLPDDPTGFSNEI